MKRSIWYFWAVVSLSALYSLSEDRVESNVAARRLEMIKASEDIIEFHGRLIDQYGQPIEGATIKFHVGQAAILPSPPLEVSVVSNAKGEFNIDREQRIRGTMFFVASISKDGYEADFSVGKRNFDCRKNNPHRFVPKKVEPVIFFMRKKELEPTFVLQEKYLDLETRANASGCPSGYDFIRRRRIKDMNSLKCDGEPFFQDLQVKATFNTNEAKWTVVLSPGNTNGGIIVSEQLLYEAPDSGYQSEYSFTPEDRKQVQAKYIYLKSRVPAIYTRLEIEHINANKDFFRLSGKSVTNPFGDRNLEQATNLPYEVTKQLTEETKKAFHRNKRPKKPDLPKLIKDAKAP